MLFCVERQTMKDNLLKVVLQAAYDSGYKDGYSKATENIEHDLKVPLSEKSHVIQKLWLTPKDLAHEFDITLSTQAKMRMKNRIPYHKIGKYVRYKRTDINQWFDLAKIV